MSTKINFIHTEHEITLIYVEMINLISCRKVQCDHTNKIFIWKNKFISSPQGSILEPSLYNIYTKLLDEKSKNSPKRFKLLVFGE